MWDQSKWGANRWGSGRWGAGNGWDSTANAFVFEVRTTAPNETFTLPLESTGTYCFVIKHGDGQADNITAYNQPEVTHTYATPGTYIVSITGTIQGWRFNNLGDKDKIYDISSWGPLIVGNNQGYFYGCSNLTVSAPDKLNISGVSAGHNFFRGCSSLKSVPSINNWDFSSILRMDNFFRFATLFNQNVSGISAPLCTHFNGFLGSCVGFDQAMGTLTITSATNMIGFLEVVTMSTTNGDDTINGFYNQAHQDNVTIDLGGTKLSSAALASYNGLIADGWIITFGGWV